MSKDNSPQLQVVYGGQWGSEGKGNICAHLAHEAEVDRMVAVRVGGPNAGHTIYGSDGKERKLQQVPVAAYVNEGVVPIIGASGLILPKILIRELEWYEETWGTPPHKLLIDRNATVIVPEHQNDELGLVKAIGSTGEGVGAATAAKVMRTSPTFQQWLHSSDAYGLLEMDDVSYIEENVLFTDTIAYLNEKLAWGGGAWCQLEGTQGYLLSLNTSGYYPFATSRDCGPEAIMSQVGVNPRLWANQGDVRIIAVMRTFPIRVAGNSGPLPGETTWEELAEETNGYIRPEITTVTKKVRRVARWSDQVATKTMVDTSPTEVALTFVDYLKPELNALEAPTQDDIPMDLVISFEDRLGAGISLVAVGPGKVVSLS